MAVLPQEASMSREEPKRLKLLVAEPPPVTLVPAKRLSEKETIDFITVESEKIVKDLTSPDIPNKPEARRKARATVLGGILGRLSMIDTVEPGTQSELNFVATLQAVEESEPEETFLRLYNAFGDHTAVRPIDAAFDQLTGPAKDDAKTMMRGAMILISKVSDQ